MSEWIDCKQKLPPIYQESKEFMASGDVLVRHKESTLVAHYTRANNPAAMGWWHMPYGRRLESVTHWMPLPVPPSL
jgi:hypothetical protein